MKGEVALITGASRGIGKAIALKFASENINLALYGRDTNKLNEAAEECTKHNVEVLTFTGDVGNPEFVAETVTEIKHNFGKVDHLINNAGVAVFKELNDTSLEEFELQVNTNLYGVFNFVKNILPGMLERKSGSIINISSLAGKNGFLKGSTYAATKHAVMGLSRSLFLEVRNKGIRVAAVCPGSVVTDMIINSDLHPKIPETLLDVSDIAEVVYSIIKLPVRATVSEVEIRPTNPK